MGEWLALDLHPRESRCLPSYISARAVADPRRQASWLTAGGLQEGIATVVVALAAYWFIYNYPDTAEFLSDKERVFIRSRLAADSDATRDERFTWGNVARALRDPKCWLYGLSFHTMSLPLYTFSLFLVGVASSTYMIATPCCSRSPVCTCASTYCRHNRMHVTCAPDMDDVTTRDLPQKLNKRTLAD